MNRFCMQDFTVHDYTQDLFDNCQVEQVKMLLLRICLRAHPFHRFLVELYLIIFGFTFDQVWTSFLIEKGAKI